jgi:hypothetical protein
MKFEIKAEDKEKLKQFLNDFIKQTDEEFQKMKKEKRVVMELQQGWFEEKDKIVFYNSIPIPIGIGFLKKKIGKNAGENIKGFLEANGIKADVRFIGE